MEQFIVSARKYRPGTFESVVGQEHVTQTLKNAIRNNHLAQAFLFCGPRGVGKTTCARILAKTINCQNLKETIEPCNECDSCKAFNQSSSFNIYELDAASNNSVEDIRALVEQVRYAPQGAKYKIYIIDEVHMLSTSAFNAFLKTLEEPPPYAIFILATTERHKILPTILSRCQIFDFNRITIPAMVAHLQSIAGKEKVQAEEEALHVIAEKADGALRDALSIFDQMVSFSGESLSYADVIKNLNILDYEYYFKTVDLMNEEKSSELLLLMDEVMKKGFDPHLFLGGLCDHIRNLLVCKDERTKDLLEVAESAVQRYQEQASRLSAGYLFNALQVASNYDSSYKTARNQRLHVELALLKLAALRRALKLSTEPVIEQTTQKKTSLKSEREEKTPEPPPVAPTDKADNTNNTNTSAPRKIIPEAPKSSIPAIDLDFNPEVKPKEEEDNSPKAISLPDTQGTARVPLNAEMVVKIWMEFSDQMEKNGKMTVSSVMRAARLNLNDRILEAEVNGTHSEDLISEIKTDLMAFLNSRLEAEISGINAKAGTVESGSAKPYTYEEKLRHLMGKNPDLPEFMKNLGLELDY